MIHFCYHYKFLLFWLLYSCYYLIYQMISREAMAFCWLINIGIFLKDFIFSLLFSYVSTAFITTEMLFLFKLAIMRYKVLWEWVNISLVQIRECSQPPWAPSLNQRREQSLKCALAVHCQSYDSLNLSAFITLQKMRNYFEWQDECDDTVFGDAHIPEIENDIFLCTELNREHHCLPLVHPKFKWTMTYELFYFQNTAT